MAVVVIPSHAERCLRGLRHPLANTVAAVLLQPRRTLALRIKIAPELFWLSERSVQLRLWENCAGVIFGHNGMAELARARRYTNDACTNEEVVLAQEYFTLAPDGRALELARAPR